MKNKKYRSLTELKLKDGFYIEVCNKGSKKGMKIRNETRIAMENAARNYFGSKIVNILGEFRGGLPLSAPVLLLSK